MGKIIISPIVEKKLYKLVDALFENEYFGFLENAITYKDKIVYFINSIPSLKKKKTKNTKYGKWYCSYKPNRNTTYFITFDYEDNIYLIKNIFNNHGRAYPAFIRGIK